MFCKFCTKEITSLNGRAKKVNPKRKFCSVECSNAFKAQNMTGKQRVTKILTNCLQCNNEIKRNPSKINDRNFCNKSCACKFKNHKMITSDRKYSYRVLLKNNTIVKVRSRWEALFIKDYLEVNHFTWQYEPQTFKLENDSAYTPDFFVRELNSYIEIKGYDYPYQIKNRELFIKQYSNLIVADEKMLKEKFNLNTKINYTKTLVL